MSGTMGDLQSEEKEPEVSESAEEKNEDRSDVLVKIGLVGDAQVSIAPNTRINELFKSKQYSMPVSI